MKPATAGRRLILLSLPFLGFGLLWALWPPIEDQVSSEVLALLQTLGVAMAMLGLGAMALGVWLIRSDEERLL